MLGPVIKPLEVIGCMVDRGAPVKTEPMDIPLNGVDVFLLFLDRVGVVKSQVALARELLGDTEIQADGLGVTDMQIAIGLGAGTG